MSMTCVPMSPTAPEPATAFWKRQDKGPFASADQSCRYVPRKERILPMRPSSMYLRASATAGVRRYLKATMWVTPAA